MAVIQRIDVSDKVQARLGRLILEHPNFRAPAGCPAPTVSQCIEWILEAGMDALEGKRNVD